jgi:hypothetical protein
MAGAEKGVHSFFRSPSHPSPFLLFFLYVNTVNRTRSSGIFNAFIIFGILFIHIGLLSLIVKTENIGAKLYAALTADTFLVIQGNL